MFTNLDFPEISVWGCYNLTKLYWWILELWVLGDVLPTSPKPKWHRPKRLTGQATCHPCSPRHCDGGGGMPSILFPSMRFRRFLRLAASDTLKNQMFLILHPTPILSKCQRGRKSCVQLVCLWKKDLTREGLWMQIWQDVASFVQDAQWERCALIQNSKWSYSWSSIMMGGVCSPTSRTIPFSKWLITMVSFSPLSRVVGPLSNGPLMAYEWGWYEPFTNWDNLSLFSSPHLSKSQGGFRLQHSDLHLLEKRKCDRGRREMVFSRNPGKRDMEPHQNACFVIIYVYYWHSCDFAVNFSFTLLRRLFWTPGWISYSFVQVGGILGSLFSCQKKDLASDNRTQKCLRINPNIQ